MTLDYIKIIASIIYLFLIQFSHESYLEDMYQEFGVVNTVSFNNSMISIIIFMKIYSNMTLLPLYCEIN